MVEHSKSQQQSWHYVIDSKLAGCEWFTEATMYCCNHALIRRVWCHEKHRHCNHYRHGICELPAATPENGLGRRQASGTGA